MNNTSSELRERAARCEDMAASAASDAERASLLRKCEALRALADSEDWLSGQPKTTYTSTQSAPCRNTIRSLAAE